MSELFDKSIPNNKEVLINPIIINRRYDVCPICKSQRLELFSFNGYPQNYKEAVDLLLKGFNVEFNKYEIRYMKCRSCKKEFTIDWTSGFPVPLQDTFRTSRFFAEFMDGY